MKKTINMWLDEYAESHQNKINKSIHWICVPLITFTLLGLLSLIKFDLKGYNVDFAVILIIVSMIFYIRLSKSLAVGMLIFSTLSLFILTNLKIAIPNSNLINLYVLVFIISWIGQFIGHKIEGKKPSFIKDIQFLLIGPIWLLSFIYKKLNIPI
ncbi:DUF962 domain-containing protein [Candidatus Marinimicrobia bacterium]|jgi:uncharacterized membrane protein YGL010W|nr:DUF962 domain-containing protein [Candidatus Neomarinimicrobiota bacterium]